MRFLAKRCTALALALCLLVLPAPAYAQEEPAFHPSLTASEGKDGDVVDLILTYDGSLTPPASSTCGCGSPPPSSPG